MTHYVSRLKALFGFIALVLSLPFMAAESKLEVIDVSENIKAIIGVLGISEQSNSKTWIVAFEAMADYPVNVIIPGHGHPSTLDNAKASVYKYLKYLRSEVESSLKMMVIYWR